MKTLLLAQDTWDLVLDISGNIAAATEPYAVAQDVASEVRLFIGELWYDTTNGIDYLGRVLGERPNMQYLKGQIETQALKAQNVVSARCLFSSFDDRVLHGQVQVVDKDGATVVVSF